jgi:hypothetical protein
MATSFRPNVPATIDDKRAGGEAPHSSSQRNPGASGGTKAMFSQALSGVLVASILLVTSISTSFAQNDGSDFIKKRNSYPLWSGSLKRDIQGFKPGMTESEAKQALSGCEVSGHRVLCLVSSKGERFELSLTEHTRPRHPNTFAPVTPVRLVVGVLRLAMATGGLPIGSGTAL